MELLQNLNSSHVIRGYHNWGGEEGEIERGYHQDVIFSKFLRSDHARNGPGCTLYADNRLMLQDRDRGLWTARTKDWRPCTRNDFNFMVVSCCKDKII